MQRTVSRGLRCQAEIIPPSCFAHSHRVIDGEVLDGNASVCTLSTSRRIYFEANS